MMSRLLSVIFLLLSATAATASAPQGALPINVWQSPLEQEHLLAGRLWEAASGQFVAPEALLPRLRSADYLLLGKPTTMPTITACKPG